MVEQVILHMKKLREANKSYNEIADALNREGILTRYSSSNKKSSWYSSTVRNILNRREIKLDENENLWILNYNENKR